MPLLVMNEISKRFDGVQALRSASLEICAGEIHALVGENGAGKSTLMKVLAGVHPADQGAILFDGHSIRPRNYQEAVRAGVSMIFQDPSLYGSLTVAENLFIDKLPRHWFGLLNYRALLSECQSLLKKLDFQLSPAATVNTLTVGERQLVEIAKATATGAKLIVMDEPTASLNAQESENLFRLIRQLKQSGVAMVYISHRLEEVMTLADRLTVLRDGQVVGTWRTTEITQKEVIEKMVGRVTDTFVAATRRDPEPGAAVLELRALACAGKLAEVSFCLQSGEILGVAGLRGSGQQTLVRALLGLESEYQGSIFIKEQKVRIKSPAHALELDIGYVTDDRKGEGLLPEMDASYNGTLGVIAKITRSGFLQSKLERQISERQVRELGIRVMARSVPVKNFSGGNQQKVVLARVLEQKPRILVLNDPTSGIDVGAKQEIYRLISRLAAEGVAVLLISSDLEELRVLSDRIVVMNRKRPSRVMAAREATEAAIIEAAVT